MWFGTADGVSRLAGVGVSAGVHPAANTGESRTWKTYSSADGLADDRVHSVAVAADGALWFGSWHGGIARYVPPS